MLYEVNYKVINNLEVLPLISIDGRENLFTVTYTATKLLANFCVVFQYKL